VQTLDRLDRSALYTALDRFSQVESLLASDRVCLAASGGLLPDLRNHDGFILHWTGSSLPWFLRPLGPIVSAGRCILEDRREDGLRGVPPDAVLEKVTVKRSGATCSAI
jgi:hypothetical protein